MILRLVQGGADGRMIVPVSNLDLDVAAMRSVLATRPADTAQLILADAGEGRGGWAAIDVNHGLFRLRGAAARFRAAARFFGAALRGTGSKPGSTPAARSSPSSLRTFLSSSAERAG